MAETGSGNRVRKVLGVSGSPIAESNTDRALAAALEATGLETELVKLRQYRIEPCVACMGCVKTNSCVLDDDGNGLMEKAREADALIVGGYAPYSTLDARTKAFLERLYPLRHVHGYMRGKPGGAVVTAAVPPGCPTLPPAADLAADAIRFYMMEEGMEFVGAVKVQGNVPCVRCGKGDACSMSGLKMLFGPDATTDTVARFRFELQPAAMAAACDLGRAIGAKLNGADSV